MIYIKGSNDSRIRGIILRIFCNNIYNQQMISQCQLRTYFLLNAISFMFSGAMPIHIILSMFQHKLFQSSNAFKLSHL